MTSNNRASGLIRMGLLLSSLAALTAACDGENDTDHKSHRSSGGSNAKASSSNIAGATSSAGAAQGGSAGSDGGASAGGSGTNSSSEPVSPESTRDAAELFSMTEIPRFEVKIADADWADMQKDPTTEKPYPAQVTFNGSPQGTISIRYKGGYGTLALCVGARGELKCPKLSMKLEFSDVVKDKRFFGLKKLNLHALVRDATKLHDKISYDLFREMDVVAPRSHFANLTINGKDYGLFATVEQIDGRFTKDRFGGKIDNDTGDGNLYKEAWPVAAEPAFYTPHLETNKTTGDSSAYSEFGKALVNGDGPLRDRLGKYMDLDYLARYMAVDDAVFNWDGITTQYCDSSNPANCGGHNFCVYQEEQNKKFWLVPWDLDGTMRILATFMAVPHWTKKPSDCTQRYATLGGSTMAAPGCDPFFEAIAADLTPYKAAINKLLDGPFGELAMKDRIDKWADFIAPAVRADPITGNEATWRNAVEGMRQDVSLLRERLIALRDDALPPSVQLSTSKPFDLEDATRLGLLFGVEVFSNGATSATSSLNQTNPLGDKQDAKLAFVYRDDPGAKAWNQWLNWKFAFATATDVSKMTGIRVTMRADSSRSVRVDIFSAKGKQDTDGIHYGWDVPVTAKAKVFELTFATADLPSWAESRIDDKATMLSNMNSLIFFPGVNKRSASGFLNGKEDAGELYVDDIEFY